MEEQAAVTAAFSINNSSGRESKRWHRPGNVHLSESCRLVQGRREINPIPLAMNGLKNRI